MNAWDHLPNAKHIDRVIASVRANPSKWKLAKEKSDPERVDSFWNAARYEMWAVLENKCRVAAVDSLIGMLWASGAWCGILSLIAYDDCAHMLDSDIGELKILAAFGDSRALFLLPACIALHGEDT